MRVDFLGTGIDCLTPEDAVDELIARIRLHRRTRVFFVNAHCVNVARRDLGYRGCLGRADFVLADGSGILLASRLLGLPIRHNLNGTDFVPTLLEHAAVDNRAVFLLGGRPGIAALAAERLVERNPNLRVVGSSHGYLSSQEEEELINRIAELQPDILLVAKGVPLQETWLDEHWERLNVGLGLAVGGLIDFTAGVHPRAPRWMRVLGIEWCFRLAQEPRRLARRYLIGNVVFLMSVLSWRVTHLRPGPPQPA